MLSDQMSIAVNLESQRCPMAVIWCPSHYWMGVENVEISIEPDRFQGLTGFKRLAVRSSTQALIMNSEHNGLGVSKFLQVNVQYSMFKTFDMQCCPARLTSVVSY